MIGLLLFGLLLTVQATAYATIRYVKPGGDGTRTGEGWWTNASGNYWQAGETLPCSQLKLL